MPYFNQQKLSSLDGALLALGGLIGAGLFVGIGTAIVTIGPLLYLSYALSAVLVLAMLRLMVRLRRRHPRALLITDHVDVGLGRMWGLVSRRVYWGFWTLLVAIEAIAGANIISPAVGVRREWIGLALIAASFVLGDEMGKVISRLEIALAAVKVSVVVVFIAIIARHLEVARATPYLMFARDHDWTRTDALLVLAGVGVATFSLAGMEIVHSTAHTISKASALLGDPIALVGIRVFGFYLISILLILSVLAPSSVRPGVSPFTASLYFTGHLWEARYSDALILLSVVATMNLALTTAVRAITPHDVDARAPENGKQRCRRLRGVCALVAVIVVAMAAQNPERAYAFLVRTSSALLAFTYAAFSAAMYRLEAPRSTGDCALVASLCVSLLLAMPSIATLRYPFFSACAFVAVLSLWEWIFVPRKSQITSPFL